MKHPLMIAGLTALLSVGLAGAASADLINGEFSTSLEGWTTEGNVSWTSIGARLDDADAAQTADPVLGFLEQTIDGGPGWYALSFDLLSSFGDVTCGSSGEACFPDTFSASVVFADDSYIALMELNRSGEDPEAGWARLSFDFDNPLPGGMRLSFSFLDGNFSTDSSVVLDNVSVTTSAVPEPATVLLLGAGLALVPFLRRVSIAGRSSTQG